MKAGNIASVCTISTLECYKEFRLFYRSLRHHEPTLPLYILCTRALVEEIKKWDNVRKEGKGNTRSSVLSHTTFLPGLDHYGAINRPHMEKTPGIRYKTLHEDFMMEKATVLRHALQNHENTIFMDSDIVTLQPFPSPPSTYGRLNHSRSKDMQATENDMVLGLSPHHIREEDEALFGKYNGGWVFTNNRETPQQWEESTHTSRYFDQAALETLAENIEHKYGTLWLFPPQCNFGYWRLFQSFEPLTILEKFSLRVESKADAKNPGCGGLEQQENRSIFYDGQRLQSVHTHFCAPHLSNSSIHVFNRLLLKWMHRCGSTYRYILDELDEGSGNEIRH